MDLPAPPARSPVSRAPTSGLKLMLAILVVFALLAAYGQWEQLRRPKTVTATVKQLPNEPVSPSPVER